MKKIENNLFVLYYRRHCSIKMTNSVFRPVLFLLAKDPVPDNSPWINVRTGPDG
jgi:hypothetical protein